VCLHARRSEIDWRLAHRVINLTEIADAFGLSRYALQSHRQHHLPACLAVFQRWVDTGRLDEQRRHVRDLYIHALNALAHAEQGALVALTGDDSGAPPVSMTEIARKIRDARAALDQLTRLATSAGDPDEGPARLDGELNGSVRAQLESVVVPAPEFDPPDDDVVEADDSFTDIHGVEWSAADLIRAASSRERVSGGDSAANEPSRSSRWRS
jgi:hypothetical protein